MKNIIPAVASTNAIVSALAVAEAIKLLTFASQSLNNFYGFMGHEGVSGGTYALEIKVWRGVALYSEESKFSQAAKNSKFSPLIALLVMITVMVSRICMARHCFKPCCRRIVWPVSCTHSR